MTTATLIEPTSDIATHPGATFFLRMLDVYGWRPAYTAKILVVGCGRGHEAAFLAEQLQGHVDAIDVLIESSLDFADHPGVTFQEASVLDLPFDTGSFDTVFFHHVIEHVADPSRSLEEISRVLRSDGSLFIGTPNRHRLFSAVGAHRQHDWESSPANKIRENLQDWKARLTGRFRNELGAHAGFSMAELDGMLARHFEDRRWLTQQYLRYKYSDHAWRRWIRLATSDPLRWCCAPGIYVLTRKQRNRKQ